MVQWLGIALAAVVAWIASELIARQDSAIPRAVLAFILAIVAGFIAAVFVLYLFDGLEEKVPMDWRLIFAGGGVFWGALAGAFVGALNGRLAAKRRGK